MRVYLSTLGCKLNESELESWARRFADDGCEIVGDPRDADICVLNTCTVTHTAAHKSRQMARQLARANPHARLVLTGCFTDIAPAEAQALPNVALIVPNADKERLVALAKDEGGRMKDEVLSDSRRIHPSSRKAIPHPSSVWSGYTDNYIRVLAESALDLRNRIAPACVRDIAADGVTADLV